jgi:hypothetical protein
VITHTRAIAMPESAGKPVEEYQGGRPVITRFEPDQERLQVGLADLSHRPKAIVQGPGVKRIGDLNPGKVLWTGQAFVSCLKPDEAVVYDMNGPLDSSWPDEYFTDVTEGLVLMGMWGPRSLAVMQRIVAVDVERPHTRDPFSLVTRCHGFALQILNLKGPQSGILLACDRSHGQNLFDLLLHVGKHLGLKPAGELAFRKWLASEMPSK